MKKYLFLFMTLLFIIAGCEFTAGNKNYINISSDFELNIGEKLFLEIDASKEFIIINHSKDLISIVDQEVTALKSGEAIIEIKLIDDSLSRIISFQINPFKINFLTSFYIYNYAVDDSLKIDLDSILSTNITNRDDLSFSINKENIISIENDYIQVLNDGLVTLNVEYRSNDYVINDSMDILIIKDEQLISLDSIDTLNVGDEIKIEPTTTYIDDDTYSYEIDNPIISINSNILKALSDGECTLTITSNKTLQKLEVPITIVNNSPSSELLNSIGVYLGVENYGTVTKSTINDFKFKFFVNGTIKTYKLSNTDNYKYHNILEEGNIYYFNLINNTISELYKLTNYEDSKYLYSGIIETIENNQITINNKTISLYPNYSQYEIIKEAGGSKIRNITAAKNDYVRILLDANGKCFAVIKTTKPTTYQAPVKATPGERTLTNFFRTALSAVGVSLYIYGGAWDYQDEGSSIQATTIGVSQTWIDFFYENDASYNYKNTTQSKSYYPFGSYNEYYYAGVDCSGYVGWIIYNILNSESGNNGYVQSSTKMAKSFSNAGLGTFSKDTNLKVGDIVSISGHVWICLGVMDDGSIVIMHSTPSDSKNGIPGGGAQLGAIGSSKDCEAYKLADQYNKKYYPDWSKRYETSLKSSSTYLDFTNTNAGRFSWYLNDSGLNDPDNLSCKKPSEILKILFNESE